MEDEKLKLPWNNSESVQRQAQVNLEGLHKLVLLDFEPMDRPGLLHGTLILSLFFFFGLSLVLFPPHSFFFLLCKQTKI